MQSLAVFFKYLLGCVRVQTCSSVTLDNFLAIKERLLAVHVIVIIIIGTMAAVKGGEEGRTETYFWMLACEIRTDIEKSEYGCPDDVVSKKLRPYVVLMRRRGFADQYGCIDDVNKYVNETKEMLLKKQPPDSNSRVTRASVLETRLYESLMTGARRCIKIVDRDPYTEIDWKRGGYIWYQAQEPKGETGSDCYTLFDFSKMAYDKPGQCYKESPNPELCET